MQCQMDQSYIVYQTNDEAEGFDKHLYEALLDLFEQSIFYKKRTATLKEWTQLIDQLEDMAQVTFFTNEQKETLKPYIVKNADVELSPQEFFDLLDVINYSRNDANAKPSTNNEPPNESQPALSPRPTASRSSSRFDSIQRTSRPLADTARRPRLSSLQRRYQTLEEEGFDDRNDGNGSDNHPSVTSNSSSTHNVNDVNIPTSRRRKFTFHQQLSDGDLDIYDYEKTDLQGRHDSYGSGFIHDEIGNPEPSSTRDHYKLDSLEQLRAEQARINDVAREYDDRISELQVDIQRMKQEIAEQKKIISQHNSTDKQRLEDIAELEKLVHQQQSETTRLRLSQQESKKLLEEKCEELGRTQEMLEGCGKQLKQAQQRIQELEAEITDLEEERDKAYTANQDLEDQLLQMSSFSGVIQKLEDENEELKHIIDKFKFNLDMARAGSALGYQSSPTMNLRSELEPENAYAEDFDAEGEAIYANTQALNAKKQKQLEKQNDDCHTKIATLEEELKNEYQKREDLKNMLEAENRHLQQEIQILMEAQRRKEVSQFHSSTQTEAVGAVQKEIQCDFTTNDCGRCNTLTIDHDKEVQSLHKELDDQARIIEQITCNVHEEDDKSRIIKILQSVKLKQPMSRTNLTGKLYYILLFFLMQFTHFPTCLLLSINA
ncbi:uncharacterized protein BYT42DRAFT_16267 [Radiomyces spectabilis]|uniref:uncharacterized protein n=1 Tax=Radiomyces spectabilis TaxID=64574 RepID=UPI00222082A5|nr:uncharacterized protein BYT42DRAFT_16267 [Radiomyces spectabilis]KAI8393717.1 hypothetical protein BYT42DRAFT_16267 [Radiomyces spectabilis]